MFFVFDFYTILFCSYCMMEESCSRCDQCTDSPENVHEYEEHRVIGKGAYGVVYLVTHIPSNIQVSITFCLAFF